MRPRALRKYPELYSAEYDALQDKGKHGRSAAENVRYRELRRAIHGKIANARFASAVKSAAGVAAGVVLPSPDEVSPGAAADAHEERLEVPSESTAAAEDAAHAESPPHPVEPVGAASSTAAEERATIPPAQDPVDPAAVERRKHELLVMLMQADAGWAAKVTAERAPIFPEWVRHGYLGIFVETLAEWGLLDRSLELSRMQKTIVTVVGGPLIYGPTTVIAAKKRQEREEEAAWKETAPPPGGKPSPEEPQTVTVPHTEAPPTGLGSPSPFPPGTDSSAQSSSPLS